MSSCLGKNRMLHIRENAWLGQQCLACNAPYVAAKPNSISLAIKTDLNSNSNGYFQTLS